MKFAVLDAHDDNYEDIAALTRPNRQAYCQRHGYEFVEYRFGELQPPERQPNWGRVQALATHLDNYDWIFYLDTDALFMNFDIPLTHYLDGVGRNCNLFIGPLPHEGHVHTASFFLRNCSWSHVLLADWWSQDRFIRDSYWMDGTFHPDLKSFPGVLQADPHYHSGFYLEQTALHWILDHRSYCQNGSVQLCARALFNSTGETWKPGEPIVQVCGGVKSTKLNAISLFLKMVNRGHS